MHHLGSFGFVIYQPAAEGNISNLFLPYSVFSFSLKVADQGVFVLLPTPPTMFYFSIQHSKQNKYSIYIRMLSPQTFLPPQDTRFYFVMYTLTRF